jgi:hypothetical protein
LEGLAGAGPRLRIVTALLLLPLASVACGKKGPPLAPLRPVPARVEDLNARRLGNDVFLQFTIPARNADNSAPADLVRMEAYAITGNPEDPAGRPLDPTEFLKYATTVATIEVEPPPPPAPEDGPAPPPPPPDPRPAQGERVTLLEALTPAASVPFVHPKRTDPPAASSGTEVLPFDNARLAPPLVPKIEDPLSRVYVLVGRSRRRDASPLSARLRVPLTALPDAPAAPAVRYDESRLYLTWVPPASARRVVQEPVPVASPLPPAAPPVPPAPPAAAAPAPPAADASAAPPAAPALPPAVPLAPLPGRPVFPGAIPHTYNVYEYSAPASGQVLTMPTPLHPQPLESASYEDPRIAYGVERCYVVRTVEVHDTVSVESAPSPPTCVTPRDTFPPAAPRNLAAVGSEGAVNLIWEPNTEPDFAGYLVLRGEAPGDKLQALTPAPIRETTFRDATAQRGVRYVYAVVAVDTATPQNVSVESNRVEETAR